MSKLRNTAAGRKKTEETIQDSKRPLLPYLRGILGSLKRTERSIAESVVADPERVITSSISEFARRSEASVGSVIAFCRRLDLEGFADFKIALAQELALAGLPAGNAQSNGTLFEKVFNFHTQSLAETLQINTQANFERVAQTLHQAKKIEFFSIGLSYPVAYTANCKLLLLGMATSAQYDSHMQMVSATQLNSSDVAFGISCSGTTQETVQCLEVAKARGATTICLTNAMKSPITAHSDMALYAAPSEIKYFQAPLASRITQLAVIDALFVFLAQKDKNKTAGRLQRSGEELLKRRLS